MAMYLCHSCHGLVHSLVRGLGLEHVFCRVEVASTTAGHTSIVGVCEQDVGQQTETKVSYRDQVGATGFVMLAHTKQYES